MSPRRIVALNFTRMGDLIQSGPLLRSLKRRWPDSSLTLVVLERFAEVASHLPMCDHVVSLPADELIEALDRRHGDWGHAYSQLAAWTHDERVQQPDLLINLAHTPLSASLGQLLQPHVSWGLQRDACGTLQVKGDWFAYVLSLMHERTHNPFNLVEIYLCMNGARRGPHRLEWTVTAEERADAHAVVEKAGVSPDQPFVALQPGASSPTRQWPVQHFAELATLLRQNGVQTVIVGSAGERELAEAVVTQSGCAAVSLAGRTSVGVLAAVLQRAVWLVSNDTGTIHVASAVGAPTVGIYLGPAAARDTGPYGTEHLVLEADLPCAPCAYQATCALPVCHQAIRPEQVLALLQSRGPAQLRMTAHRMNGVRVFQTSVDEDGTYHLLPLKPSQHGGDETMITYYRWFWKALLDDRPEAPASLHESTVVPALAKHLPRVRALLNMMESAAAQATDPAAIALARQQWQSQLHALLIECPDLAPLLRFVLARTATMHTAEDLRNVTKLVRRGLDLMQHSLVSHTATIQNVHEAAR